MVELGGGKKASHSRGGSCAFADIVGQDELKRALLAVGANADLDGLLIRGEKGTAKSTAVRALTGLLPAQTAVADCPYGCPPGDAERQCVDCRERTDPPTEERPVPLVTLPLGATRERVVGTLSVADALAGDYEFDAGLLARANRGILYVDEVNLLDDHLVDVLLDAAASGHNRVERDGISVTHPADFTLVGTMNPEEGELRPQLRDRFALQATVTGCDDLDDRVTIIEQALGRGEDTSTTAADGPSDEERRSQLRAADERLPDVTLPAEFTEEIAELCREAGVEGHRGDIATARAARTFAALDDRPKVLESDVRQAAALALPHRLKSRPFEDSPDPSEVVDDHFDDEQAGEEQERDSEGGGDDSEAEQDEDDEREQGEGDASQASDDSGDDGDAGRSERGAEADDDSDDEASDTSQSSKSTDEGSSSDRDRDSPQPSRHGAPSGDDGDEQSSDSEGGNGDEETEGTPLVPGQSAVPVGEGDAPDLSAPEAVADGRASSDGGRSRTEPAVDSEGARVRTQRSDSERQIDAAASVRAASARGASAVDSRDLRQSVRQRDSAALVLFVVDASASMRPAMRTAKGTVLELLKDAYQQRDEVGFVAFAGEGADVLLPPTDSVTLAARHLKDLPTGDRTPLPAGLRTAGDVLDRADPAASVVVVVTDGRANVAEGSPVEETRAAASGLAERGAHVVVVDAGEADVRGVSGLIAEETDGQRVPLSRLSAERVDAAVSAARESKL